MYTIHTFKMLQLVMKIQTSSQSQQTSAFRQICALRNLSHQLWPLWLTKHRPNFENFLGICLRPSSHYVEIL